MHIPRNVSVHLVPALTQAHGDEVSQLSHQSGFSESEVAGAGLAAAIDLIQKGQEGLNSARGRINNSIINVTQINERHTQMKLYLKGVTEQVIKTDLASAATEVSNHQAALQATFQVYSRLSQLRLSDYL
jgi:flagellin-like hook-associated protein FlgL